MKKPLPSVSQLLAGTPADEILTPTDRRYFLQVMRDKSGSFYLHDGAAEAATLRLIDRLKADAALAPHVLMALSEMSGTVHTSGYHPVGLVRAPGIQAGGYSPFGALLNTAIDLDEKSNIQVWDMVFHVIIGDWKANDDVTTAIARYHQHQNNFGSGIHAFLVNIGDDVNTAIADTVSTRYKPFASPDAAYDEIFDLIYGLMKNVSRDLSVLKPGMSINLQ